MGMKHIIFILVSLLVSACGGLQLERLDNQAPAAEINPYHAALFSEYIAFAQNEYDEGDYLDSDAFALKARSSLGNGQIGPDAPTSRDIPRMAMGELGAVFRSLTLMLQQGGDRAAPIQMARAVSHYDCWLQEQEENFQPDDIARCRGRTLDAMDRVVATLQNPTAAAQAHIVFFRFNQAGLKDGAVEIVAEVARLMKAHPEFQAYLYGHADAPGTRNYNKTLSERRVKTVKDGLASYGIAPSRIHARAYGEDKPMVERAKGAKELKNRRVEIILSAE